MRRQRQKNYCTASSRLKTKGQSATAPEEFVNKAKLIAFVLCLSAVGAVVADTAWARHTGCTSPSHCRGSDVCTAVYNNEVLATGGCVDPTGGRSATDVLQADLDALPDPVPLGMGVLYRLPPGAVLLIDDPDDDGTALTISRRIRFDGNGSRLTPDISDGAFAVIRVIGSGMSVHPAISSNWSTIRDLTIGAPVGVANSVTGILSQAHGLRVNNVWLSELDVGAEIHGLGEVTNANNQLWRGVIVSGAQTDAIHVHGADSQASLFEGIEVLSGAGIRESSFLGNTWVAPTIEESFGTSFAMDGDANNGLVLGAYIESEVPPVGGAGLWIGGDGGRLISGNTERIGSSRALIRFGDGTYGISIPGNGNTGISMSHAEAENEWRWRYEPGWNAWTLQNAVFLTTRDHPAGPLRWQLLISSEKGRCSDGIDNDGDLLVDSLDPECT